MIIRTIFTSNNGNLTLSNWDFFPVRILFENLIKKLLKNDRKTSKFLFESLSFSLIEKNNLYLTNIKLIAAFQSRLSR